MPKSFLIKKKKPESEVKTTSAESQLSTPDVNGKVGSFISPLPSNERSFSLVAPSNSYNYTASTQLLIKKEAEDDEGYNIKSKTFSQPEVHGILGLNVRSQGQVHAAEFLDSTRSVSVIRASRVVATSRNYEDAVKIEIPCEEEALLKLRPLHASTVDPKTECSASPCHDSSADNACFLSNGVIPHTLNGYTSPSAAFAISTEDQKPVSCYADDSDDFQLTEFIQFEESCVLGSPCKSPRSPSISETSSSPSPNGHVDVSMETTGEGIPAQGLDHVEGKKYRYPCDVCGKSFSRSNTLTTHKRIHTGDKPFKCEQCGRAFRQPGNLTRHRLTHTTVKPYVCPQCNKAFNRASNLHTHMRTHTNYKPFICDFCGKGFHQKIDMKIHRYTHTGEKPHKCQKCGRGFKQLTHLTYHMRTHSDVRMYECEYCGKGFNQKGNLQAHIYGHTGQRPYKCDFCGKGFTLASTLNTHKRTHASKKPFQCQLCDKAFYQKNALKTHYIASHPFANGVSLL